MKVMIGIDPHKRTHTAAAVSRTEEVVSELFVRASARQADDLLEWAKRFGKRTWAVEAATGVGYLLSQQLVARGEEVYDVPATLSARVRLLGSGSSSKSDPHDARSAAIVALRHPGLCRVRPDDHRSVLRVLAKRHLDLAAARTRTVCRLHALVCELIPGGMPKELVAAHATAVLAELRPEGALGSERHRIASELLTELRGIDAALSDSRTRMAAAVAASGPSVTDIVGVGPVVAALLIGYSGDILRFPSADHYASYNGTAPIEASSGERTRHRLSRRGNRRLNHALHIAAVTQIRHPGPGRDYFEHKVADGKTAKEALRALKRRISDAVYRQLVADARRADMP